jgi:hypothetical protein
VPLERWRELATKLSDNRELFGVTAVVRAFHCNRRQLARSRELALELARMAEGARDFPPIDRKLALTFASEAAGHEAVVISLRRGITSSVRLSCLIRNSEKT